MFFEMIKREMPAINLESIASGGLSVEEVHTQLSNTNDIFSKSIIEGRTLLSIIISDDKLESEEKVQNDNRQARYDGVILGNPSWLFIIENKPSKDNIWLGQLNPNVAEDADVSIIEEPCCLSWRSILSGINSIIQNKMASGFEELIIDNFIEFVDNEFPWLNPYTNFSVCKGNLYLLNKRCVSVMSNYQINGNFPEVKYHRGWKNYIISGKNTVKQIALDANLYSQEWEINLWLHAGDTMNAAKETFKKLDVEKLLELEKQGFQLSKNFHVSYRSSNLLWFEGTLSFEEYIRFWKKEYSNLKQIKRADFADLFNELEDKKIIVSEDRSNIKEKILDKRYDKLNICPGFLMKYTWKDEDAIRLDKSNMFDADFKDKVEAAFSVIGGI